MDTWTRRLMDAAPERHGNRNSTKSGRGYPNVKWVAWHLRAPFQWTAVFHHASQPRTLCMTERTLAPVKNQQLMPGEDRTHIDNTPPCVGTVVWVMGAALIVLSTLFRGGNRYLPLLLIEAVSIVVVFAVVRQAGTRANHTALNGAWGRVALVFLVTAPVWVAFLFLTPLPANWWAAFPGRGDFQMFGSTSNWHPLSLTPEATWAAVFAGLPIVACFIMALATSAAQLERFLKIWIAVALVQALLGLVQLGPFPALYFGLQTQEIVGTFASKNTYSNFLVMSLPIVVLHLLGRNQGEGKKAQSGWLWGLALFVLMSTLIVAQSRTAIATGLLVLVLAVALLPGRKGRRLAGLPWSMWGMALLIALALMASGFDWLDRFEGDRIESADALRALTRESTWLGVLTFWPIGSGLGSYATVFPRYQAPEVGRHLIDLAHSDYLQLLMELGAFGLALITAMLALLLSRAVQLARIGRRTWQGGDALAVAAGLGTLAFALHAWVDYPMRIPANAMFAAFLVGVFLRPPSDSRAPGTS